MLWLLPCRPVLDTASTARYSEFLMHMHVQKRLHTRTRDPLLLTLEQRTADGNSSGDEHDQDQARHQRMDHACRLIHGRLHQVVGAFAFVEVTNKK